MRRESQGIRRRSSVGRVYQETVSTISEIGEALGSVGDNHHPIGRPAHGGEERDRAASATDNQELEARVVRDRYPLAPVRERIKPKLWTPHDLANYLQVNVNWIYRRTPEDAPDRIPHIRMGKLLRFDADSEQFKNWLKAHGKN
jgi:hypothetical protein